jgi:hypothetical protein
MPEPYQLLQCLFQYLHLLEDRALAGASGGILQLNSTFVVQTFNNIIT